MILSTYVFNVYNIFEIKNYKIKLHMLHIQYTKLHGSLHLHFGGKIQTFHW